uniref:Thioredoxin domain-containing protein n=1 Tax=Ditylenchus dipsaci TaxID=166011 RepID=A0A915DRB8_9BILA
MSIKYSMIAAILLFSVILLLAECLDSDNEVDGDILVLNTENFQDTLVAHEYLLVLYYQNGSSASSDFLGKLPALAKHLKKINSAIHVAMFEDNAQKSYKINYKNPLNYPALILHYDNQWTEYKYKAAEESDYDKVCLWLEDLVGEDVLFGRNQKESKISNGTGCNLLADGMLLAGA